MNRYKTLVANAAKNESDFLISNRSREHAKILFQEIINLAKDSISIVTGECEETFYNGEEISSSFMKFIERTNATGKIKIILDSNELESQIKTHTFIKKIVEKLEKYDNVATLEIYQLNKTIRELIGIDKRLHILLVDKDGPYRLEAHGEDNTQIDASANFGDKKTSLLINTFIERLLKSKDGVTKIELKINPSI